MVVIMRPGTAQQEIDKLARQLQSQGLQVGITKGVALHVRKVAPLGDPMELNVRGYELSVRKADAEMIEIA